MSMKDKIKNFFLLEEDDEDYYEQSQQSQPQQQHQQQEQRQQRVMSQPVHQAAVSQPAVKKVSNKERRSVATEHTNTPNLVSITQKSSKVVLAEPRVYAEAQDIAEHLKSKRAVVVNLQRIDKEQGIRIIDFLSGTICALGGDIKRIGTDIFLCTPDNVEVDGNISEYYYED
ncbi:cell division protein SepF [Viridibacillus sp. FSL R5-0477]|uniref:Cell division protein SepF n=1 Tax=Viridibacillus arenosi FSL R5-213 TaxID=1227360 RepID=W4F0C7_9BACL|nr:cell division protein SepF [Viridibacillus arenosi]ETT85782.1 cell division machinery factor [Viridibacillus arenosi FSL R5-213]OMC93510.1 cell division protein SepF [Viridibacillus arenosi]